MAYFRSVKESGGGGGSEPIFSSTILYDSGSDYSSKETIILSNNYHNYDLIKFTVYESISTTPIPTGEFVLSPKLIDEITNKNFYISFFSVPQGINYGYCLIPSNDTTFTRKWFRETSVIKVEGLQCTNKTVSSKILLSQAMPKDTEVSLVDDDNLFDYDAVGIYGGWNVDESSSYPFLINLPKYINTFYLYLMPYMPGDRTARYIETTDGLKFKSIGTGYSVVIIEGYKFT